MPGGAGGLCGHAAIAQLEFHTSLTFGNFPSWLGESYQIRQGFGKNARQERRQSPGTTETAGSSPCISSVAVTPCAFPEHLHTLLLSLCVLCVLTAAGRRCGSVGNARVSAFNSCFALLCCAAALCSCLPSVPEALFNTQLGVRDPCASAPPGPASACVSLGGLSPTAAPLPSGGGAWREGRARGRGLAGGAGPGGAPSSCRPPALPTCEDVMSAPHYPNYADLIGGPGQWGRAAVPTC